MGWLSGLWSEPRACTRLALPAALQPSASDLMAFLAEAASTVSGVVSLMQSLKTEREPTVFYKMQFPKPGMKMKLLKFYMQSNLFKSFDFDKYNDTVAHELGGTILEVCGSGYCLFYSEEHDMGLILAFSNPDVGTNKIGGALVKGKPTEAQGNAAWNKMDDHYDREVKVSELGPVGLYVRNQRGEPARGYYEIR